MTNTTDTADFLFELGVEELPLGENQTLNQQLASIITEQLTANRLSYKNICSYCSPRRLAIFIENLSNKQPSHTQERKGPAVSIAYDAQGNPTPAAIGFAKSCKVALDNIAEKTDQTGSWLHFTQTIPGQLTKDLLPNIIKQSLKKLRINKRMHWGSQDQAFVRPVHWVVLLFGQDIINAEFFGKKANRYTYGHRFHAPEVISLHAPHEYQAKLAQAYVVADFNERKQIIYQNINKLAAAQNSKAIIDPEILAATTGLTEYPVALIATFAKEFLALPKECLISAMQVHQKCFALENSNGQLQPQFILISNIKSKDENSIIQGNERVMHARLADALFHFEQDKKHPLSSKTDQLKNIVYEKQLGSLAEKVSRISKLSAYITSKLEQSHKHDASTVTRAVELCKADLVTNMVYEFPELQGTMGSIYAKHDGESEQICTAIKEHYLPRFAQDDLPSTIEGQIIALADRLDTLVGLFAIGKEPSGENDPFGLRRQTLAILRICIECKLSLDLADLLIFAHSSYPKNLPDPSQAILKFCFDRLKFCYQQQNLSSHLLMAIQPKLNNSFVPLDIEARMQALDKFKQQPSAEDICALNKRVNNIKSKQTALNKQYKIQENLFANPAENALYHALNNLEPKISAHIRQQEYLAALTTLATLSKVIEDFFENVMVNCKDENLKLNRLSLLGATKQLLGAVADLSLL